jgi:hypothetical protein
MHLQTIPSRSFGSNPEWLCNDDSELLTLFSHMFPLPEQASWATLCFTTKMIMHVISVLRMTDITLDEWRRLPKIGQHIWDIGQTTSGLWDWTLTYRGLGTPREYVSSQDLLPASAGGCMEGENESRLARSLTLLWLLVRRSHWPVEKTPQILGSEKLLPWLQQTYDGWRKEDPATTKQLPVEANVPELLADRGRRALATERYRAVRDLTLIAFYYLLWIGKYTIKGNRNETKQTVQFKRCNSNGRT